MEYVVIGSDGKEYGPVGFEVLKEWVADKRVNPQTTLKIFETGQTVSASSVGGLFNAPPVAPPQDWSQPPSPYQGTAPYTGRPMAVDDGRNDLWGAIIRSGLAILVFFLLKGIGLIFGGYALYYAIRCQSKGHKFGMLAIVISGVVFVAILIGWVMRLEGGGI